MVAKLKINDRVKRLPFPNHAVLSGESDSPNSSQTEFPAAGTIGTIKAIREESSTTAESNKEKSMMIQVLWDNGTLSYFGPDLLERV